MRRFVAAAAFAALSWNCVAQEAALRARALELGDALRGEGFEARDGFWSGKLEPGNRRSLAVNLFAGNSYVFCAATPAEGPAIGLFVRDAAGKIVATAPAGQQGFAAVGVTPGASGRYFVELESPGKVDFCLVYYFR